MLLHSCELRQARRWLLALLGLSFVAPLPGVLGLGEAVAGVPASSRGGVAPALRATRLASSEFALECNRFDGNALYGVSNCSARLEAEQKIDGYEYVPDLQVVTVSEEGASTARRHTSLLVDLQGIRSLHGLPRRSYSFGGLPRELHLREAPFGGRLGSEPLYEFQTRCPTGGQVHTRRAPRAARSTFALGRGNTPRVDAARRHGAGSSSRSGGPNRSSLGAV